MPKHDPPVMEERHEPAFLRTPAQHRQWAHITRKRGRPDLAFHHEQLARVIEKIAEREAEHPTRRSNGSHGSDFGTTLLRVSHCRRA